MAQVINLRMARKAKAKAAQERTAETNRAAHGETRAVREARKAEAARAAATLDGAKRGHD